MIRDCWTSQHRSKRKSFRNYYAQGVPPKTAKNLGLSTKSTVYSYLGRVRKAAAARGYSPDHDMTNATPETHYLKGTSTLYDEGGNVRLQWVKSNAIQDAIQDALKSFADELADSVRGKFKGPPKAPKAEASDTCVHYKIGDAHLGLYAWANETGSDDHDLTKASEDLIDGLTQLVRAAPSCGLGVIVNVGDFLHSNDSKAQTPGSGNQLDMDGRFSKVFRRAAHVLRYAVHAALSKHENVIVLNARGNHDKDAAVALGVVLEAYFEKEPRVTVLNGERKILSLKFGDCLHLVYHGEKNRNHQYEYATKSFRKEIGEATHVYMDNGHTHHIQRQEIGAIVFEVWSPLVASDQYHADNLYGAGRAITSVTYDKRYGEIGRNVCSLQRVRDRSSTAGSKGMKA